MEPVPLQDQLDQALMLLFYLPWLPLQPKGMIFLVNQLNKALVLLSHTGIEAAHLAACQRLPLVIGPDDPLGEPPPAIRARYFSNRHEIIFEGMEPQGEFFIPLISGDRLLGILTLFLSSAPGRQTSLVPAHKKLLWSVGSCLANIIIRKRLDAQVLHANQELERANQLIRKTFGRYMSDEIVETILGTPEGLRLGGEKKVVTVLMTDLRGFTAIGERLPPEEVITILNIYLKAMTEIILKYSGTIIEFLGDGILALFGAPVTREDDACRAVACALEMQQAMPGVNAINQKRGFPELEMGGGINTGPVVAGNIGSDLRTKYGVVGNAINLTARIESLTVGGQILVSESTFRACAPLLRVDDQWPVQFKGMPRPITVYQVGSIAKPYDIHLPQPKLIELIPIDPGPAIRFTVLEGKHAGKIYHDGRVTAISVPVLEIASQPPMPLRANLKLTLFNRQGGVVTDLLYGKVVDRDETTDRMKVHLTAVPPKVVRLLASFAKKS